MSIDVKQGSPKRKRDEADADRVWQVLNDFFGPERVRPLREQAGGWTPSTSDTAMVMKIWAAGLHGNHKKLDDEFFEAIVRKAGPATLLFPRQVIVPGQEEIALDPDQNSTRRTISLRLAQDTIPSDSWMQPVPHLPKGETRTIHVQSNGFELPADFMLDQRGEELFYTKRNHMSSIFSSSLEYHVLETLKIEGATKYFRDISLPMHPEEFAFRYAELCRRRFALHKQQSDVNLVREMMIECARRDLLPDTLVISAGLPLERKNLPVGLNVVESRVFALPDGTERDPLTSSCFTSEWFPLLWDKEHLTDETRSISIVDGETLNNRTIRLAEAFERCGMYDHKGVLTDLGESLIPILINDKKAVVKAPHAGHLLSVAPVDFQDAFYNAASSLSEEKASRFAKGVDVKSRGAVFTFLCTLPLASHDFFRLCIELDLPLPLCFLLFRPLIQTQTHSMLMFRSGGHVGTTVVKEHKMLFESTGEPYCKRVSGQFTRRFIIFDNKQIVFVPHVASAKYLGGAGTVFWDPLKDVEAYKDSPRAKDLFSCVVPVGWLPNKDDTIDMKGVHDSRLVAGSRFAPLHYPTSLVYRQWWEWPCVSEMHPFSLFSMQSGSNYVEGLRQVTLCRSGSYFTWDAHKKAFAVHHEGKTDFGPYVTIDTYKELRGSK